MTMKPLYDPEPPKMGAIARPSIGPRVSPQQYFAGKVPDVSKLPLGMRVSNNPGNIKYSGSSWQRSNFPGLEGPSTARDQGDPQAQFANPEAGMAAAARLARLKYSQGMNTVGKIIGGPMGWTPGHTSAPHHIARQMGIGVDDHLDLTNPEIKQRFLRALITQEHGPQYSGLYDDDLIKRGIAIANDGSPAQTAAPAASPAGGPPMPQSPVLGMLRPVLDGQSQPQPAGAPVNTASGIGAISPEHMQTLARMGLLKGRQQPQPKNVGEALGQLGDMYVDQQNRRWAMGEMRKSQAAENSAWSQYGGGGQPASGAPVTGTPPAPDAPPSPAGAGGGMITAGMTYGSNPVGMPEANAGQPAIAPGMIGGAPGADAPFTGAPVQSQPMAPPPVPIGMTGGPERLTQPQAPQPASAPGGDPRMARLDAEEAMARRMVGNQYTRERGIAMLDDIRKRRYQLEDPMAALQRRDAELGIATKQRELDAPRTEIKTVKEGERILVRDPRTGRSEWITPPGGGSQPGDKDFRTAMGKKQAEIYQTYIEDGDSSIAATADFERMRELNKVIGSGAWEGLKPTIGPWAESLGISIQGLGDAQAFQAIANKMAPNMRPKGSGSTSDKDMSIFMASLPQLSNTPQGREMIMDQFQSLHDYKMARAAIANDVANGLVSREDGTARIKAIPDPFARFKERDAERRKGVTSPAAGAPSPQGQPAPRAAAEPVGAKRTVNGQPYVKTAQGWVPEGQATQQPISTMSGF